MHCVEEANGAQSSPLQPVLKHLVTCGGSIGGDELHLSVQARKVAGSAGTKAQPWEVAEHLAWSAWHLLMQAAAAVAVHWIGAKV